MKKIAVIGFGFMGVVHAKNILANKNLKLCAIIDSRENIFEGIENTGNKGNLDLPVEQLKKTPVYKTIEECCQMEKPDAVSICVPLFMHYELTKKALNMGLDVLLEKPFCPEPEQCRELIELAETKDLILMVAHCIRFAPQYEFLAECIRDKRYGNLKLLSTARSTGEPTWGVWQDPEIKKTCGGSIFDLLVHDIDFVNYCFGNPANIKVNLHQDEYWELALQYAHEAAISIKGGFLYRNTPFAAEYAATFEKASIRFSSLQADLVSIGTDKGSESKKITGDGYFTELEYFRECIAKRNSPLKCSPVSSMDAIEICTEIRNLKSREVF